MSARAKAKRKQYKAARQVEDALLDRGLFLEDVWSLSHADTTEQVQVYKEHVVGQLNGITFIPNRKVKP